VVQRSVGNGGNVLSYLAFTQWALLADPPPEMRASVVIAGPQDFSLSMWEGSVFALETFLSWSDTNSFPLAERPSLLRQLTGNRERTRRLKVAFDELPMARAAESALHARAPWEWLEHPDLADPTGVRTTTPTRSSECGPRSCRSAAGRTGCADLHYPGTDQ
jgi:predicted acyl esterase